MKPHVKLAYSLIIVGMGLFMFERFGLDMLRGNGTGVQLSGDLLSLLVLTPLVLIGLGCLVFLFGGRWRAK